MSCAKRYYNGCIYTVEEDMPYADAMAVLDGKIIAIGKADDVLVCIQQLENITVEKVDLEGKFLMPEFIDSYAHPVMAGTELLCSFVLDF